MAPATGQATLEVVATEYLDAFVVGLGGTGQCDVENQCLDAYVSGGNPLSFAVTGGSTYYLVVDGYDGVTDDFTITLTCS